MEHPDMGVFKPGQILQGRYRVVRLLGKGGTSWVYQAEHRMLKAGVALKVIKPEGKVTQLQEEAVLMASLEHPHLVRTFDLFTQDGLMVLVLELVEGRNLEQVTRVSPKQYLSQSRVLLWAETLLEVLEYLHGRHPPVIVRDLKPKNIMLGRDGELRLIDFGLAKEMSESGRGTGALVQGMASKGFAPPEQHAKEPTDARSDLYALGATLYFLLTGFAPHSALYRLTEEGRLRNPCELNPTVSERTWEVLQRLLELSPADRPAHVAAARELLLAGVELPRTRPGRRCVTCHLLLQTQRREGIEIDRCLECGGLWLDRGELGRLVDLAKDPVDLDAPLDEFEPESGVKKFLRGLFDS